MISLLVYYSGSVAALDIHLHLDLGVRMGTECKGMYGNRILVDGKQWELFGMHNECHFGHGKIRIGWVDLNISVSYHG